MEHVLVREEIDCREMGGTRAEAIFTISNKLHCLFFSKGLWIKVNTNNETYLKSI